MIKTHSDDPDVAVAAAKAGEIINEVLSKLPKAEIFDYGGHEMHIGEYGVCPRCTTPIAEAQAASAALAEKAKHTEDETVREHLRLAADLLEHEAETAVLRAEFHNGQGTEAILNRLLGFQYERHIGDDYQHTHNGGTA
jgi:hypothetical protein